MSFVIFVILVLGSAGCFYAYIRSVRSGNPVAVTARLGKYGLAALPGGGQVVTPVGKQRSQQNAASRIMDRVAERGKFSQPIALRLERADLKWTPGEFLVACLALFFLAMMVGLLVFSMIGLLIGAVLASIAPWVYLARRTSKRRAKFLEQLPDMAQMMGNSMRAGFSIIQSMELVANEGPSPAKDEFQRVIAEVKLGLPLDEALQHLSARTPSEEIELAVIAINVQRQVGGNLAEILMVIAKTVRERIRFKRDLRALTAQARYSSYIITALPVAVAVVINFMDQPYESFLYRASLGHLMIAGSVMMLGLGFFFLNRIANIEV